MVYIYSTITKLEPRPGIEPGTSSFGLPPFYLYKWTRLYISPSNMETLVSRSGAGRHGLYLFGL